MATKKKAAKKTAPKKSAKKKTAGKSAAGSTRTAAKKTASKKTAKKKTAKKTAGKKNKLGVKNSLVNNINAKKKKGTSRSKKNSTVDKESYNKMEDNWGKSK